MPSDAVEVEEAGFLQKFMWFWNKAGVFVVLVAVWVILAVLSRGMALGGANVINVIRQVSIIGVIAVGMTGVILLGLIDLSVGSIVAFTGIIIAAIQVWWMKGQNEYLTLLICIVVAIAAGAAVGFFNGFVSTKGRIHPFIVTLGSLTIFRGATMFVGGGRPITGMSQAFRYIGAGELFKDYLPWGLFIPVPMVVFLVIVAIAAFVLRKTAFGRSIYAIGGNQEAAYLSGIMVDRVKIATFTILGGLCGVSSLILTSRLNSGEVVAGQGYELDVIASVIIGGTSMNGGEGGVIGTLAGALLIGVIQNGLNLLMVQPYWQLVVKGAIIILAVLMDRLQRSFQTL
ncbi:MAG: ABC transporter permease [Planctomycetota bacterium]|jgi:ribose/xylose/arabinose/galactoside ABC-type transport system permease subunit|nr:ABC transporter permease [Planctomycetota bacterium]